MPVEVREEFAIGDTIVSLRHAGATHVGAVRASNEDSFLSAPPYWIVADGMGGHAHGDLASRAAIEVFASAVPTGPASARVVLDAVRRANDAVVALRDGSMSGTTLTGVAIVDIDGAGPHWMTFNVGDSRTYSWDGRRLEQQSIDHSAVQELVAAGLLSPEDAAVHPQRNIVTRALGAETEVEPDVWLVPVRARQTFLLCSDGLTKELGDDEIARIIVFHDQQVAREPDGPSLAERLVGAAVAAGGRDNVTVVVVESEVPEDAGPLDETVDRDPRLLEDTMPRA
ncbi:PP2C family protein-serine/threonine phosphatase [Protaetiibacter mangrovi]|uniref:Protein phosphatase 2C domain-containing protein n=1 Tax=Protaetiibacter mangrovi TaxID=2970926 RepID=A0ABT1ZHY3_9MICO|nr:protein phosphatase 2C domain-containing protein [Protaetiibacter mangrovi]MCS0500340.1 protein phosphatase 2C domain-containing protein [Protaetiibacter mangrovi]